MKIFLSNEHYAETTLMCDTLHDELVKNKTTLTKAVENYNTLIQRVNTQTQVDQWRKQENNPVIYPDLSETTMCQKMKLTPIRTLVRQLLLKELNTNTPVEVVALLIRSYLEGIGYSLDNKESCVDLLSTVSFGEVVRIGLQYLSNKYAVEITVNCFVCNELLKLGFGKKKLPLIVLVKGVLAKDFNDVLTF